MKNIAALLVMLFVATSAFAADEMKKLDFLIGEWKGEAWMQMGPGQRERVSQTESVQPKAGGKVLLVEGLGKRRLDDGTAGPVVHDAIALISWDETRNTYRFNAHVAAQPGVDTTLDLIAPRKAVWGFEIPGRGKIRYTISLTEKGEWLEVGEFSGDGKDWTQFFEMRLQKVK